MTRSDYQARICIDTDHGTLDDVPAVVAYTTTHIRRDPATGYFRDRDEIDSLEIVEALAGDLKLDRYQLDAMSLTGWLERAEAVLADSIQEQLDHGEIAA